MEISTFELLTKRIAPPTGTALDPVSRRVVQGYFLTISNLEAEDYIFRIEFTESTPNPADPKRTLQDNAVLLYDIAGDNIEVNLVQGPANKYQGFFKLPAGQTASVQLLPKLPQSLDLPAPGLEVRGYVSLFFVPNRRFPPVQPPKEAVKVLLNAEIRGTFLPDGFPSQSITNFDFDQINYSLALASGQALNLVPPKSRLPIRFEGRVQDILNSLPDIDLVSLETNESDSARMLVELLSQVEPTRQNLQDLSDLLSKLEIPIRMCLA